VGTATPVGIFGGTFDPPHAGHVVAAVNVRAQLGLERVLMVPAAIPWQKAAIRAISAPDVRLELAQAAFGGIAGLDVSTLELDRGGESYTADTVDALLARGAPRVFVVVGSDLAPTLDTWKRPEVLRERATIVVYDRPGSEGATPPEGWSFERVAVPQIAVSSTDIRARVREGLPIDGMVDREVARLITARGLYRDAVAAARS
jgi:nicotinate-nucleotide adenylyltransferase